jgi:hypothetical protein
MEANTKALSPRARHCMIGLLAALIAVGTAGAVHVLFADPLPPVQGTYVPYTMDQLQQMVAPIALYPDALLAQVLSACTYPSDVIAAAQWEDDGGDPLSSASQPWDSSVQGVARFPDVLHYLRNNAEWMNDLGDAVLNQQSDVMTAVQNLRAIAVANGTLISTPQQTVINEGGYIQIIPANPDVMYCPIYDSDVAFGPAPYLVGQPYTPCETFSPPCYVGIWFDFDVDWCDRAIYSGTWGRDRPWWHDHDPHDLQHYADVRPGTYAPGRFSDPDGHPVNVPAARWAHNDQKPTPQPTNRPAGARPFDGPDRGYGAEAPDDYRNGTDVTRESARGQSSRQQAGPERVVAPNAPAPAPREEAPAPQERPSAPVRGGAVGGYEEGASADRSSARGSESRGGGGGGGGGRR